jgi:hypothetical protein
MVNSFGAHVLSPVSLVHSHLPPLYAVVYSHNQMSEIFVYKFILVTEGSSSLGVLKGLQNSQNSRLLDSSIFLLSGPGI